MSTILIQLKAQDNASASIKKTEKAVEDLGKKSVKMTQDMGHGATDVMGQLDALGNRFRYMSIVVGTLAVGSIAAMKSLVDSAREAEQAFLKLGVFAVSMGEDMDKVNQVAKELAATGLIGISEAAEGLAGFLATGLGLDKAADLMWNFLNSASVAKTVLTDTVGVAVNKAAVGFRTFREIQIDNAGIQGVLNVMWAEYGKTIEKTRKNLTELEKYQAMYNYYMREGTRFTGAATLVQGTFSGSLSRLSAQFLQMKIALGQTLIPLIGTLSDSLAWATEKIAYLAKEFPGFSSVILVGVTALSLLAASLAMVGAMIPMLVSGFVVLHWAALKPLAISVGLVTAKFIAASIIIGSLIYLILKVTGKWKYWTDLITSMPAKIAAMINPFDQFGEKVEEVDKKLAKQLKSLQQNINLATRDFQEGMTKWAKKHDETVKDLGKQIGDLEKEYKKATDKIRKSFTDTMSDLSLAHSRKTEDLQREIDEEVSKGIWADQTRIRELRLSLKRENEDYAMSAEENLATKDEQLAEEQIKYNDRLVKLKTQLDEELKLEQDNATLVAWARTQPILDELKERSRAYSERLKQYEDELVELQENAAKEVAATGKVIESMCRLGNSVDEVRTKLDELYKNYNANTTLMNTKSWQIGDAIRSSIGSAIDYVSNKWKLLNEKLEIKPPKNFLETLSGISNLSQMNLFRGLFGYQQGGIIPGPTGQAIPIIAHAGETVLPVGMSPLTININNPSVRSSSDITMIANAVKDVLSRQQYLRHFK